MPAVQVRGQFAVSQLIVLPHHHGLTTSRPKSRPRIDSVVPHDRGLDPRQDLGHRCTHGHLIIDFRQELRKFHGWIFSGRPVEILRRHSMKTVTHFPWRSANRNRLFHRRHRHVLSELLVLDRRDCTADLFPANEKRHRHKPAQRCDTRL